MKSFIMQPHRVKHHGNHVASTDNSRYLVQDCMITDEWKLIPWSGYSVDLTASSTSVTVGNSVTLTATVLDGESSPASGETVTFYSGTTSIYSTTTNSSGVATCTYYPALPSTVSVTAVCRGVTSEVVTITVSKITSTISLSAASSSVIVGSDVSLSGTLSVGSGESVKIYQGTSLIDTVTTGTNGAFTKTVSGLSAGTYTFKATYDGDSTHTSAESSTVSVTVGNKPVPTISLGASSSSITVGNSVTMSGQLTYNNTGLSNASVKIYNGNTLVDTVSTNSQGYYTKSVSGLTVGTHSFTAVFEGSSSYAGVTSTAVNVTVNKIASTISLATSSSAVTVGNTFTLSGTLSVGSGCSVKLYEDETLIDTLTTGSGGAFSKTITASTTGTYDYWVKYEGDSTHAQVMSSDVTVTVSSTPVPDSISLTADKSILSYADSESATLTATVLDENDDPVEGETVTFYNGSTSMGTATTNSSGVATKTYASSGGGDVSFTAQVRSLVSETYELEDCIKYDTNTYQSSSVYSYSVTLPSAFECSFVIKPLARSSANATVRADSNGTTIMVGQYNSSGTNNGILIGSTAHNTGTTTTLNTELEFVWTYQNGTHTVTWDGHTATASGYAPTSITHVQGEQNNPLKNLKVKAL